MTKRELKKAFVVLKYLGYTDEQALLIIFFIQVM